MKRKSNVDKFMWKDDDVLISGSSGDTRPPKPFDAVSDSDLRRQIELDVMKREGRKQSSASEALSRHLKMWQR